MSERQPCDQCSAPAKWVVQDYRGPNLAPVNAWYGCGRHLHAVLTETRWDWEVDAVQVQDMGEEEP